MDIIWYIYTLRPHCVCSELLYRAVEIGTGGNNRLQRCAYIVHLTAHVYDFSITQHISNLLFQLQHPILHSSQQPHAFTLISPVLTFRTERPFLCARRQCGLVTPSWQCITIISRGRCKVLGDTSGTDAVVETKSSVWSSTCVYKAPVPSSGSLWCGAVCPSKWWGVKGRQLPLSIHPPPRALLWLDRTEGRINIFILCPVSVTLFVC